MAYFSIYQGLHGCYMPDSDYVIKADTRKELKRALQREADSIKDAGGIGMNKKAIAWLANVAWKDQKKSWEFVAPYKWKGQDSYSYALGIFTGVTRKEYLNQSNY